MIGLPDGWDWPQSDGGERGFFGFFGRGGGVQQDFVVLVGVNGCPAASELPVDLGKKGVYFSYTLVVHVDCGLLLAPMLFQFVA